MNIKSFIEVGSGTGYLSHFLLNQGLTGIGFDLNPTACEQNRVHNHTYIDAGKYLVQNSDFVLQTDLPKTDMVLSSMVLEHLPEDTLAGFMEQAKRSLNQGGIIVTLVPGSPKDWGIEDEIAGHVKRYTFAGIHELGQQHCLKIEHLAGLTFPLSNFLLPISNALVQRYERVKLSSSARERTIASGKRNVPMKTSFPHFIRWIINEVTLYPFYLLQLMFLRHPRALVIYSEMRPL